MATREEKQVRLELPSTSGVECEIREIRNEFVVTFYQNERQLKSCSVSHSKLNQDQMVDLLSDAGVEFFSFSAIFDVADLLVNTIKKEFQVDVEEEKVSEQPTTKETGEIKEVQIATDEIRAEPLAESQVTDIPGISLEPGDKLLKKFEMSYSKGGYAGIYYCLDGKYAIILYQKETPLVRKTFSKENINADNLVEMISESGIDFLSFSAIYDSAEYIQNVIIHPEEYLESGKTEYIAPIVTDSAIVPEKDITTISEVKETEDEVVKVDLSALDISEYSNAEDFDKFIVAVTSLVNEGQPIPVKEVEIEKTGGVICIILRQLDNWYIRFRKKSGSLSDVSELGAKIDQDEIARIINQDIPQISFSYLYDASEMVSKTIEKLTKHPMGEIILNVAVGHFLQIIEQHEADGDLKAASQTTEVLLERFRREQNTKGILQFGNKLLGYLEERKKITQAIKLRNTLAEELLEINPDVSLEFVLSSLDSLIANEKFLNAANLCGLILDHYLAEESDVDSLKSIMMLGRKQVEIYKKARLPSVMEENALRYARYAIKQVSKFDDKQITTEQREAFQEDLVYFFDNAFESQEERKANFELLESIENTLELLKEANEKTIYVKYFDKLLLSLETQNKRDRAVIVTKECTKHLLDSENFVKACDYGNKAIKLFYELNKIAEAIDFSIDIVRGLIDIKETGAARDYLNFVISLVDKAYKADDKRRVEKQLIIGDLFGKLGLKDQAKAYIQGALQTIGDAKKREKIVLDHVDDLLSNNAILSAQEMVNQELSRLLTDKKIDDVIKFCQNYIMKLREYEQQDMVFEYMKYCTSLLIQTDYTDYKILISFIKDLVQSNEYDRAAFIMNQLITLQSKQEDYTRAIDAMSQFIDSLIEHTERFDLVEYYIQRIADTYREMGDKEGALEALISFQKRVLEHSVELAQRITDTLLKELEQLDDYKKSISLVSPMIDKQMELGKFQDAYIFSVQNARYYERLGDIGKVIQYLESVRDKFLKHEQSEDANRMTDLILRFGRSHKKHKLAITSMKDYSKNALDRGDTETSTKFALEVAALLEEENQGDKALEFLQMIFNETYERDKESALGVFQKIMIIRAEKDNFSKIAKKYLEPLFHKHPDFRLIETTYQALKPPFEEFFPFSERIFDEILNLDEISDDIADAVVNFVISTYDEDWGEEGDRIANKYATKFINSEQISSASRLMATVLERTKKPISEVLSASFNFIKELINNSLLEGAREYTDRVITMITSEKKFGSKARLLAAKIAEKFAIYVAPENQDLASEYAYQAATFYRSLNDFEGVVNIYKSLANEIPSPKRAIRAFKRGINICKKFKADKPEAQLLYHLTEYLITSNNVAAIASFQQTLEKFENFQDLEELFNVVYNLIEISIKTDNLKIADTYLDYLIRLSAMINKKDEIGGIVVFLLRHAEEVKDNERLGIVQKYIGELGIKPKKYNKDYANLAKQRMAYIDTQSTKLEAFELEKEPEAVPELVKTEVIVPTAPEVTAVEPSQEAIADTIDEEFVSVIKQYEQETPEEAQAEIIQPPKEIITPPSDELPLTSAFEPSSVEVPSEDEPIVLKPETEEIKEEHPFEKPESPLEAALSDDEVSSLFSMTPFPSQEAPPSELDVPLEDTTQTTEEIPPQKEVIEVKQAALSDNEMDSLFIPKEETLSPEVEQLEVSSKEKPAEDEWEVDGFGRLWKKGTLTSSTKEPIDPKITTEEYPSDLSAATPDLSPLEKIIQEDREIPKVISEDFSEEPQDTITRETRVESFVDFLKRDEKPELTDIFDVPQVEYQEITPSEEPKDSQVQAPDLIELFSDALSELGTIGGETGETGETGESEKSKKKKK